MTEASAALISEKFPGLGTGGPGGRPACGLWLSDDPS